MSQGATRPRSHVVAALQQEHSQYHEQPHYHHHQGHAFSGDGGISRGSPAGSSWRSVDRSPYRFHNDSPHHHQASPHHYSVSRASSQHSRSRSSAKSRWSICKDYIRCFVAFMLGNVGICGLVVGYTIMGALAFSRIEGSAGLDQLRNMRYVRQDTAARLWLITDQLNILYQDNWTDLVTNEVLKFQEQVVAAVYEGYDGKEYFDEVQEALGAWSFSGAFLYSLTVITTIGYGNLTPRTVAGKLITILYAIIGIPLFLLYLTNIGGILAKSFKWMYARLCKCQVCFRFCGRRRRRRRGRRRRRLALRHQASSSSVPGVFSDQETASPSGEEDEEGGETDEEDLDNEEQDLDTITVPITLCLTIMVSFIVGGATLFSEWEKWDLLEGSYFCFISLSTIGFGDFVPGDSIHTESGEIQLSFILTSMYLMLGMALIAMCFNLMQEEVVASIRNMGKRCGLVKEEGEDDEEEEEYVIGEGVEGIEMDRIVTSSSTDRYDEDSPIEMAPAEAARSDSSSSSSNSSRRSSNSDEGSGSDQRR